MKGSYDFIKIGKDSNVVENFTVDNIITNGYLFTDGIYLNERTNEDPNNYTPEVIRRAGIYAPRISGITNLIESPYMHVGSSLQQPTVNDIRLVNYLFTLSPYGGINDKHYMTVTPTPADNDVDVMIEWISEHYVDYARLGENVIREVGMSTSSSHPNPAIFSRAIVYPDGFGLSPGESGIIRYRLSAGFTVNNRSATFVMNGTTYTATWVLPKPITKEALRTLGYSDNGNTSAGDSPNIAINRAITIPNAMVINGNVINPTYTDSKHPSGRWMPNTVYEWTHAADSGNSTYGLIIENNLLKGIALNDDDYGNNRRVGNLGVITITPNMPLVIGKRYRLDIGQIITVHRA